MNVCVYIYIYIFSIFNLGGIDSKGASRICVCIYKKVYVSFISFIRDMGTPDGPPRHQCPAPVGLFGRLSPLFASHVVRTLFMHPVTKFGVL